jgi:hypothetical protein
VLFPLLTGGLAVIYLEMACGLNSRKEGEYGTTTESLERVRRGLCRLFDQMGSFDVHSHISRHLVGSQ